MNYWRNVLLEIILKYIVTFFPVLLWFFDKTYRMAHKRKFFKAQREALQSYINDYYQKLNIEFVIRDIAAREVTCRDDVGGLFLDFCIKNKCNNIFNVMHDFINSWAFVNIKKIDDENIELHTRFKKKTLEILFISIFIYYVVSVFIFLFNDIFLWIFKYFDVVPFYISKKWFDFFVFFKGLNIILAVVVLLSVGRWVASILSLAKKLPVKFEQK